MTPEIEELKQLDSIIVPKPKAVLKSYSGLTLLANILVALSAVGFSALGAFTQLDTITFFYIILGTSTIGFIGKFIQQDIAGQDQEGPMGFKGLSIRFVWYIEAYLKAHWQTVKGWFGK